MGRFRCRKQFIRYILVSLAKKDGTVTIAQQDLR